VSEPIPTESTAPAIGVARPQPDVLERRPPVNDLIVVVFDRLEDARTAMRTIRQLEREGLVQLEDSAIVERAEDGKVRVKNELSGATEMGAAVGALIGAVITFFFPVVGMVVGGTVGALVGSMLRTGVEKDFVEEVKRQLSPGRSALFLVIRHADADALVAAMRPFKGEVLQATLPSDVEEELREALAV
jgi:uncharacterized membrane protein